MRERKESLCGKEAKVEVSLGLVATRKNSPMILLKHPQRLGVLLLSSCLLLKEKPVCTSLFVSLMPRETLIYKLTSNLCTKQARL